MDDNFDTIAGPSRIELKEKGSRFIAEAIPVDTVESAESALLSIRKREHAATHHCYAYVVREQGSPNFKYSDDGEPNGTAGKPIYDVINGAELVNLICVVTRYFGGTKLGTGGLVRAYSAAAKSALENAKRIRQYITVSFLLAFSLASYDRVNRMLQKLEARIVDSEFGEKVRLRVEIRKSRHKALLDQFRELTSGQGRIEEIAVDG